MIEEVVNVNKLEQMQALFGNFDKNINMLQKEYNVIILSRGSSVKITGAPENTALAKQAIES